MPTLRSQIDISAPADKVFEYVSDFRRHSEWATHPLTIEPVEPGPTKVGSSFKSTSKMMGTHNAAINIVELDTPKRIVFEAQDDSGRFRHTMEVQPLAQGSRLVKSTTMTGGSPLNKVMAMLLMPVLGRSIINKDVRRIKQRLESAEA